MYLIMVGNNLLECIMYLRAIQKLVMAIVYICRKKMEVNIATKIRYIYMYVSLHIHIYIQIRICMYACIHWECTHAYLILVSSSLLSVY